MCKRGVFVFQLERTIMHGTGVNASDCGQELNEEWNTGFAGMAGKVLDEADKSQFEIVIFTDSRPNDPSWPVKQRLLSIFRPELFKPSFFECKEAQMLEHQKTPGSTLICGAGGRVYHGVQGDGRSLLAALNRVSAGWSLSTAGCVVYFDAAAVAVDAAGMAGFGAVRVPRKAADVPTDGAEKKAAAVLGLVDARGASQLRRLAASLSQVFHAAAAAHGAGNTAGAGNMKTNTTEFIKKVEHAKPGEYTVGAKSCEGETSADPAVREWCETGCGLAKIAHFKAGLYQLEEADSCLGMPTLRLEMVGAGLWGVLFEVVQLCLVSAFVFVGISVATRDYLMVCIVSVFGGTDDLKGTLLVRSDGKAGTTCTQALGGAWLLAIGTAAPEITIAFVGAYKGTVNVGMGTVFGSALIAFTLIPGISGLAMRKPGALSPLPYLRDTSCYLCVLFILVYQLQDGRLTATEAAVLVMCQPAYYAVYLVPRFFMPEDPKLVDETTRLMPEPADKEEEGEDPEPSKVEADAQENENEKDVSLEEVPPRGTEEGLCRTEPKGSGCAGYLWYIVAFPFRFIFRFTIPRPEANMLVLTALTVFVYLAVLSFILLSLMEKLCCVVGVPISTASVTLMALGSQVPDITSGYWMAKKGMPDGSLSWIISSQVTNLCLGVGLPAIFWVASTGSPMLVPTKDLDMYMWTLTPAILLYVVVLSLPALIPSTGRRPTLGRVNGAVLIGTYVACICAATRFFQALPGEQ